MKVIKLLAASALLFSAASHQVMAADTDDVEHVTIELAGHQVPVVKDGLYDRFRSNPPLSVIADESPDTDLSWFRTLKKEKLDVGFETYSPNFYYENTKVTAIFTADIDRLRELMPVELMDDVQPLKIWPGRGLVALTAYAYHYCDNDTYNEISLAIVTNKPGGSTFGPLSLIGQGKDASFWGYVLKLPVDTKLAAVRGVVGYNLPKWVTGIHYREEASSLVFEVMDSDTGKVDFVLETAKLNDISEQPTFVTNSFTNIGHQGERTWGHAVSRHMKHGSSMDGDKVSLTLGSGSFSEYLRELDLGKMIRYDYVPDFQSALYAPESLDELLNEQH
ncbi:hypothetical protein [uncultured Thalassolituus sp.]|uniref:hypothetical protein n=1 Tax=uncultured Thalassolituus sp. TaxID=285273 RepID=UPI00261AA151|nr:hypothetical protein [uncultured Thalassolituus sp.]